MHRGAGKGGGYEGSASGSEGSGAAISKLTKGRARLGGYRGIPRSSETAATPSQEACNPATLSEHVMVWSKEPGLRVPN